MIVCSLYFIIVREDIREESIQVGNEKIVKGEKEIEEFLLQLYKDSKYAHHGNTCTIFGFD